MLGLQSGPSIMLHPAMTTGRDKIDPDRFDLIVIEI